MVFARDEMETRWFLDAGDLKNKVAVGVMVKEQLCVNVVEVTRVSD